MIKEVKGFIAIVVLGIVFGVINILIMYKNKDKKEKEFVRAILPIGII